MIQVPEGSIYYWMFTQGIKRVPLDEVLLACSLAGKEVRPKDEQNYWNGYEKHKAYSDTGKILLTAGLNSKKPFYQMTYDSYPVHPLLGEPEIKKRWVPCREDYVPLFSWRDNCKSKANAKAYRGCKILGENMRDTKMIVIDCDGDHDDKLDIETMMFLCKYMDSTHCLYKPKMICDYPETAIPDGWSRLHPVAYTDMPASYHLTFSVDRVIPTMHFNKAHVDIVGNKMNSLRFIKNKVWNGMEPMPMTNEIWEDIKAYLERRENRG